ncbi:MAG: MBL fold metallo-hydrolase [Treponema sp.]|nr:MBL fold metallo-hydrolase [Treponema sp.]
MKPLYVIRTGVFGVNTLVIPLENGKCFVVDPAACALSRDESKITDFLRSKKLECAAILLTHSHFDHVTGIAPLKKAFPAAQVAIHEAEFSEMQNPPGPMGSAVIRFFGALELLDEVARQPPADLSLKDGDNFYGWKVIHTPGHTPGSICLYNKEFNEGEGALISGDTLFDYGGYGRTDMYGGDEVQIMHSLGLLRKTIPSGTKVYPGHDSFGFSF